MRFCELRDWLGHGKWNAIGQILVSCAMIITCGVGQIYGVEMFPRLLCAAIFLFGGIWTLTTVDDFRPFWIILRCVYKPCCGERREGKCLQCWIWMQIFCFVLGALVLTVSAMTLGEPPKTESTEPTPTGDYIPSVGFNSTMIGLCSLYLALVAAAIVVFFPCLKSWYMEETTESIIDPTIGNFELPPPITNPQRYSTQSYAAPIGEERQVIFIDRTSVISGAPAEGIK